MATQLSSANQTGEPLLPFPPQSLLPGWSPHSSVLHSSCPHDELECSVLPAPFCSSDNRTLLCLRPITKLDSWSSVLYPCPASPALREHRPRHWMTWRIISPRLIPIAYESAEMALTKGGVLNVSRSCLPSLYSVSQTDLKF